MTPRRRVQGRRDLSRDRVETPLALIEAWNLRQQRLSIGVIGRTKQVFRRCRFDDPTQIHDQYAIRDMLNDAQIMTDEQISQIELFSEIHEEVENLRLYGDVKRRHGLIADEEFRPDRQGAGNAYPLALTAGKLVRIAPFEPGIETDAHEQIIHIVSEFILGDEPMK